MLFENGFRQQVFAARIDRKSVAPCPVGTPDGGKSSVPRSMEEIAILYFRGGYVEKLSVVGARWFRPSVPSGESGGNATPFQFP